MFTLRMRIRQRKYAAFAGFLAARDSEEVLESECTAQDSVWDAHLTRKSLMFAKSFRWLKAKFAICVVFYIFIRPHET